MDQHVPPTTPDFTPASPSPASRVSGPAVGLIVTAAIGMVLSAVNGALTSMETTFTTGGQTNEFYADFASGTIGLVFAAIGLVISVIILIGAIKMKRLESYGFSFAVCILAMIPCMSPCCVLGLPFGIWGLVVLSDPAVKEAFR